MQKIFFIALCAIALFALFTLPAAPVDAAADATCTSNPPEGPAGTVFYVTCQGYSPNTPLDVYMVEPDGAVHECDPLYTIGIEAVVPCTMKKTDEHGVVVIVVETRQSDLSTLASGKWTVVAEELGIGYQNILHRGEGSFVITGGTEGVSGAELTISPSRVVQSFDSSRNAAVIKITITGSGFEPYEIVSIWAGFPNSDCSSTLLHLGDPTENVPLPIGLGSVPLFNLKADAAGRISTTVQISALGMCQGEWHIVGRGNSSRRGGDGWVTVTGESVDTNAYLTASSDTVIAWMDHITFSGWGFAAGETIACWITSPQGQVLPVYVQPILKADSDGRFSLTLQTGGGFDYYPVSEGAQGEYAITCRGGSSGNTAIARYRTIDGWVDP